MRNLITDVPGLLVGNADDAKLASGVTASCSTSRPSRPATSAAARPARAKPTCCGRTKPSSASTPSCCRAARPSASTRRAACRPGCASRAAALRIGPVVVPIVPGAILFDLINGGDKDWGRFPPYRDLGYCGGRERRASTSRSAPRAPDYGATTVNLKGGLGSASATTRDGATVGAIVAVNARRQRRRSETDRISGRRRSSRAASSAGAACPRPFPPDALAIRVKGGVAREHHHCAGRDRRDAHQGAGPSPCDGRT